MRPPSLKNNKGFTFVEIIVAMSILVIISALTLPNFIRSFDSIKVKNAVQELVYSLKRTRQNAMLKQSEQSFFLDIETLEYKSNALKTSLDLPEDINLSLITAQSELINDNSGYIRFFEDGSSTGGSITLSYKEKVYKITINWLTGHIAILE